jgi:prepilin-type processing-associated H-X9-DG protein
MNETNATPPPPPIPQQQQPPIPEPPPPTAHPSPAPLPVMSYATPAPSNQPAVLSFVFGLLFFIPFVAPGIAAILLGRRGVRAAKENAAGRLRLARLGIALGVLNLVLSLGFAVWTPFALRQARQQAVAVQCMSNMRQLGMGMMMYASTNRGWLPPTLDQLAASSPALAAGAAFNCPACGTNPAKPPVFTGQAISSHYHYVPSAGRLTQIRQPGRAVILYEPPTNHDNQSMNLLFADGHVERISGPVIQKIAAELAAGQNPPPSKK